MKKGQIITVQAERQPVYANPNHVPSYQETTKRLEVIEKASQGSSTWIVRILGLKVPGHNHDQCGRLNWNANEAAGTLHTKKAKWTVYIPEEAEYQCAKCDCEILAADMVGICPDCGGTRIKKIGQSVYTAALIYDNDVMDTVDGDTQAEVTAAAFEWYFNGHGKDLDVVQITIVYNASDMVIHDFKIEDLNC